MISKFFKLLLNLLFENHKSQFDIINLANTAKIKSAKINQNLVENQNKINEQKVYEQINAIYFNILSFEGQKRFCKKIKPRFCKKIKPLQNGF